MITIALRHYATYILLQKMKQDYKNKPTPAPRVFAYPFLIVSHTIYYTDKNDSVPSWLI